MQHLEGDNAILKLIASIQGV